MNLLMLKIGALLLTGMILVPCATTQENGARGKSAWPTYHGAYTLTGVADTSLPDRPALLWRFKAGGPVDATPVSAEGRIYFTSARGRIFALDLHGRRVWMAEITEDSFSAPPMYTDGSVIVGSRSGRLHAYGATTGKVKWTYDVGGSILGTANRVNLAGDGKGVVVISQADGAIHCVNLTTGKGVWKTGGVDRCDGSASVSDGRIVMGSCASALHVFSVDQPKKRVDIPLGKDCQVAGGVALSGQLAFAGTRSGNVCAVDVVAGKILWTNRDSKNETFTTPAVNGRRVVVGSDDGHVYCLDRATGLKVWKFDTGDSPSSPVIAAGRVVVSSGGAVFMLDLKSGRKTWTHDVSDWITSPAVAHGRLIVGTDDGTVTAFGRKDR